MVREAYRLSVEERPGAVHLELPEDIAAEECDDRIFKVVGHRRPDADEGSIRQAAKMIESAKMPFIVDWCWCKQKKNRCCAY